MRVLVATLAALLSWIQQGPKRERAGCNSCTDVKIGCERMAFCSLHVIPLGQNGATTATTSAVHQEAIHL